MIPPFICTQAQFGALPHVFNWYCELLSYLHSEVVQFPCVGVALFTLCGGIILWQP